MATKQEPLTPLAKASATHLRSYSDNARRMRSTQLLALIDNALDTQMDSGNVNIQSLADSIGLNRFQLNRRIKRFTGKSMRDYAQSYRLKRACLLLRESTLTISEVGVACGFDDNSYFSRFFRKETGMTPSQYIGK